MKNSVLHKNIKVGSASLRGVQVMSARYGMDLLRGFTSSPFGADDSPHLDIGFPLRYRRSPSRLRAMMPWLVSGWHPYPIAASRNSTSVNPYRFSLKLLPFPSPASSLAPSSSSYPDRHSNGCIVQCPAFSPDPTLSSTPTSSIRQSSDTTDIAFPHHQRF